MSNTVPFYVIETLIAACGLKPTDNVQNIEITAGGVLVTLAYTVETEEGWKTFTVDADGQDAVLTFRRFFEIERPAAPAETHTHEDGETHTHEEELVEADVS